MTPQSPRPAEQGGLLQQNQAPRLALSRRQGYWDSLPSAGLAASAGTLPTEAAARARAYLATFLLESLLFGLQNEQKTGKG